MQESWLIKYVLEIEVGRKVVQRMVIPLVSSYQRNEAPATTREWTFGTYPVKQKMGYREARISLSGNAGNVRREGYTHTGETKFLTGERLFAEFDQFMRAYELEGAATEGPIRRSLGQRPRLIFRSMEYGTADYVEVERYSISRNDGNARMMTTYSLDLVTEGPVKRQQRIKFGSVEQQDQSTAQFKTMAQIEKESELEQKEWELEQYGTPDRPLPKPKRMPAGMTRSSLAAVEDQLPVRWSQFRGPIVQGRQALRSVRSAADAVRTQLALPRVVVADLFDTFSEMVETLEAMHDAIPGAANREDAREVFYDAYAALESTRVQALTNLGATGQRLPPRSTRQAGTGIAPPASSVRAQAGVLVTTAQLQADDTLPQFAARELGDPDLWRQIMDLNDMASPYEAASGVPLYGGLTLNVPYQGGLPQGGAGNDLFGTDLRFQDGDLVLNGTTDLSLITGPPNYRQRISRRLSAIKGENGPFPEWGMPKLIGEPGLAGTAGYIASHVREQCEADPATKRVENLALQASGDTYEASFSLIPVVGSPVPVVTAIPS